MRNMYAVSTLKDITMALQEEGADLKFLTKLIMLTMLNTKQVLISPLRKGQRQNGFMLSHADNLFKDTPYENEKFLLVVVHSKNEESCVKELLGDK